MSASSAAAPLPQSGQKDNKDVKKDTKTVVFLPKTDGTPSTIPIIEQPLIYYYRMPPTNFSHACSYQDVKISACRIQGRRNTQEDFLSFAIPEIEGFPQLSEEAQRFVYQAAFFRLQKNYGHHLKIGSTGTIATTWIAAGNLHVWAASVGDSLCDVVILNQDHKVVCAERINKLHTPNDPDEAKRMRAAGHFIKNNRINASGLEMTRALGDLQYCGISAVPDITGRVFPLSMDHKAVVIITSDGFQNTPAEMADMVKEISSQWRDDVANHLVMKAYQRSLDNISAVMIAPGKTAASGAVFDGHGGDLVAQPSNKNCYHTLSALIQTVKTSAGLQAEQKKLAQEMAEESVAVNALRAPDEQTKAERMTEVKQALDPLIKNISLLKLEDVSVYIEDWSFPPCPRAKLILAVKSSWHDEKWEPIFQKMRRRIRGSSDPKQSGETYNECDAPPAVDAKETRNTGFKSRYSFTIFLMGESFQKDLTDFVEIGNVFFHLLLENVPKPAAAQHLAASSAAAVAAKKEESAYIALTPSSQSSSRQPGFFGGSSSRQHEGDAHDYQQLSDDQANQQEESSTGCCSSLKKFFCG